MSGKKTDKKKKKFRRPGNPYAKIVRTPLFRQRVVANKKKYRRKNKHNTNTEKPE